MIICFNIFALQEELKKDLWRMRREKERAAAQKAAQAAAAAAASASHSQPQHPQARVHNITTQQHDSTTVIPTHKRKREEEREGVTSAKSKKKKMISTTSTKDTKKDTKLYCICKTPYDETKYESLAVCNITKKSHSKFVLRFPGGKKRYVYDKSSKNRTKRSFH